MDPRAAQPEDAVASGDSPLAAERAARERAELAVQARDQFLAIAAHDLRSPLNGIQSWANVLQMQISADAPPLMVRALAGIKTGVEQQARLIEELLDKARVLNGTLELNLAEISPVAAARAAIAHSRDAAGARGVQLALDAADAPDLIRADASRLEQMMRLLLSDASASAPKDSEIRLTFARTSGGALSVRVTNQGNAPANVAGAPAQARNPESRRGDIGLLLVRRLAELQGGSFSMEPAQDGEGMSVEVTLPLK